jgi:uncharacterized repeat protein (TIGR01451 family)
MNKYIRYVPIATVLLLPFLSPFAASEAGRDGSNGGTRDALSVKQTSALSQDQTTDPGQGKPLGNLDIRLSQPTMVSKLTQKSASSIAQQARTQALDIEKGISRLRATVPGLDARVSPLTGAVEVLRSNSGALSKQAPGQSGSDIVRSFIQSNSAVYGLVQTDISNLNFIGESVSPGSGMRMVRVEQTANGLPIFQSETRFILDAQGRVFSSIGLMIPNGAAMAPELELGQLLSAPDALGRAMASVDISVNTSQAMVTATNSAGTQTEVIANSPHISGNVTSKLVYFPLAPGVLIPAWSQITFTDGTGDWYTLVDANTGALLWRKNIRENVSAHDARFRVYVQADGKTPADSCAPQSPNNVVPGAGTQFPEIAPTIVSMHSVMDATASPNGWIDDCPAGGCTANETQTIGNNVHAYMDAVGGANANIPDTSAAFVLDGNGKPTGNPDVDARNRDFLGTTPRDFQTGFLPPPQGGNPEAGQTATGNGNNGTTAIDSYRRGVVTQLFYVANWYHDRLYNLGFNEAAGNFQQTNFSGTGGVANDRVLAEAQDNSGTNNANFSTPPDGSSGRAQMYRFTGPTIDRDGDLDAEVLVHEMTHGVSNRLVGNAAGLLWNPARGMGEGWSDFYSLSLLNNTNADDPNGRYATGAYATYKFAGFAYFDNYVYGIRRFPYSTDNTVNPLTWADVDDVTNNLSGGIAPDPLGFNLSGGMEVHNIGEVWALTLWEVRSRIIAANGNDVPTGNQKMLQLVTDALKMTPINPTFIDARDALIDADCVTNGCANEQSIWDGFADRGLGYKASAPVAYGGRYVPTHMGIQESFSQPYLDINNVATDVTIDDSNSNNNGAIDPGEPIKITVKLKNPWRGTAKNVASATATLTTSTPGVTIYDNASTYPAIPAQGSAVGDTFLFTVPTTATAGQSLKFTITPSSSLGSAPVTFVLRVGKANGTDPAITYTHTPTTPLAISDNRPRGVFDTMNITDDFEIADLNFRVDSMSGPAVDDLTVMLRAPNGYGTDLIALVDGLNDCGGPSITNMVIDDDLPATSANDMVQATSAAAPYTKSWLPVYNSPWAAIVNPAVPGDPVGELGRLDGTSTQGNWTALVADVFSAAAGGCSAGNGTFSGWSLLITPRHFDIAAFAPTAAVTGTKTASGTFLPASTVTYTVTLTNNGTGAQADNAGNEFTDILPSQLTLVSAAATSGTAGTSGNTVTWNGSLAPLGGSVTITITATINANVSGVISNQGSISYDADLNGTNETTKLTDDPSVGGAADPTSFTVLSPSNVSGTKTRTGSLVPGSTETYTVVLSNSSGSAQLDNPGDEFVDVLPAALTLVSATASGGTAVANVGTNTVRWNGSIPGSGSVTITITATLSSGATVGATVSNQGTINYDADGNGTNETTKSTDDPSVGGASDPTSFTVLSPSNVSGTKTRTGSLVPGSTETYTVVLSNSSGSAQLDNPGDEFVDVLPAALTLVSATASGGTAVANVGTNTVRWNGSIPGSGSVTITITATLSSGATVGATVSNQGTINYDADGNGTNEASRVTDDPSVSGTSDPTSFVVDPAGGFIRFSSATYSTTESSRVATMTVTRTGALALAVTVDYATPDDSAATPTILPCSTPGFVSTRCDYTTAIGTLRFAAGENSKTFNVLISQDNYVEAPESLSLTLSNPTGSAVLGTPATATLTITDDASEPAANPIDDSQNYVRQHYHDFLNREPDPSDLAGLTFWTSEIESCGANQGCRDIKRQNVSGAFFFSIEFQQTGYYVYRTYKVGFGDLNPPTIPVPVRYREFVRDTQEVQRGVVVGVGAWQAQLDSNKQAFALAFVKRPEFLVRYPTTTTATAFVDALNTNAGSVLTPTERASLISGLSANPADDALRANALMTIAENTLLKQQEMNRAFVLMQYFGYLRRNPDAAPEAGLNFAGNNFWLNKLNSFNGNFMQAEMVKAFITSAEYRNRSGQ